MFITVKFWAKILRSRGVKGTAMLVMLRTMLPQIYGYV